MAVVTLTSPQACNTFWQQRIALNLGYWQNYLTRHIADVTNLDREWESIVRAISLGLEICQVWSDVYALIIDFSGFMERRGYWDIWQTVLEQALQAATRAGDEPGAMTLLALLARLHQRQGHIRRMVADYRRTIRLARQTGNRYEEARACTNLGFHFIQRGYWHRGEVLCCHALSIFEALGSDHGRAHTENHLGVLYYRRHELARAEQYLTRACTIWQSMGDLHGLLNGNNNLGMVFVEMTEFDKAIGCFEQAKTYAEQTGDTVWLGNIYHNLGLAHQKMQHFDQAETYLRQARQLFKQFVNHVEMARVEENFGVLYLAQQRFTEARLHLETAQKSWRELGYTHSEIQAAVHLVECELAQKRWDEAEAQLTKIERELQDFDPERRFTRLYKQVEALRDRLLHLTTQQ